MLASLTVRDIVLIERAELHFAPGLNVLTGETGAGKSILLDALGLAAGERGLGRTIIRAGAEQGAVSAIFDVEPGHPACALLKASELGDSSGEIILRRTVSADGRSRAFVNDSPVGIGLAREIGAALLEVHGQADDRGLFDAGTHRLLLDAFGTHTDLAVEVAGLYAAAVAAEKKRDELGRSQAAAAQEVDYLSHAASELRELAPKPGEEASLSATRALLMNAGRLGQEIAAALDFVAGDGGVEIRLGSALRRLSRLPAEGKEAAHAAETALDSALALIQEGRAGLESLLDRLDAEPGRLEQLEERLFAIRAAARKYQTAPDALAGLQADFETKLAAIDGGGASIAAAQVDVARAHNLYRESAVRLSTRRAETAKQLEQAVTQEFAPLKLGGARFRVALTPLPEESAGANGLERIAFEIATIEGASFGPLAKIASGGELARFALALKVALAQVSPPAVLVFDEVDRGVGGAVAAAVGERLQRLAQTMQVLLVTHSPQVAARASRHFRITRAKDATRISELSPEERVEEIARMLSGAAVTDEARAAARRLVVEAQAQNGPKKRARA
ncbi:MAG TPA: DNA repair protein RecN [Micropepsaceae bacterium]|nr:DNA repair protein RecN [Micropepsaceae bacterium]